MCPPRPGVIGRRALLLGAAAMAPPGAASGQSRGPARIGWVPTGPKPDPFNAGTARLLGATRPPAILAKADRVID